jgi:uncharacterized membrane protein
VSAAVVALVVAVFLASCVEMVEATTIVLAIGLTRGWRSGLIGVASALAVLAVIVAVLGPALTLVPIGALRLVVGALLLVFGLGWLRSAILRAAGLKLRHDEETAFREHRSEASAVAPSAGRFDAYGFTVCFKGVLLEGLEVAFIVVTFGADQGRILDAGLAAAAAVVVVLVAAVLVRAPLARVPENTMKFAVGTLLTSFGTFWGTEGAGAPWPGGDAALLALIPAVLAVCLGMVAVLRRGRSAALVAPGAAALPVGPR